MAKNKNAIITLGLKLDRFGNPSPELEQRVDKAAWLFEKGLAPHLVMTGSHSFSAKPKPPRTEAAAMLEHALSLGVPAHAMIGEHEALDTIGSALKIKEMLAQHFPDWKSFALVTSGWHLPRAVSIFEHVLGLDHEIMGISSDSLPLTPERRAYEAGALLTAEAIFGGTKPGDHKTIRQNLVAHIPAYTAVYAEGESPDFSLPIAA